MKTIARLLAFLSVAPSSLLYVRIRAPINPLRGSLWILRLLAEAVTAVRDVWRVTVQHPGFAQAFGVAWERAIAPEQQSGMLRRRWTWHLPAAPEPRWQRDVPFWNSVRAKFADLG